MVSKASDDLPLPDSPVMTTRRSRGSVRSMFLRLCCRAPRISILSRGIANALEATSLEHAFQAGDSCQVSPPAPRAGRVPLRGDGSDQGRHGRVDAVQRRAIVPEDLALDAVAQ